MEEGSARGIVPWLKSHAQWIAGGIIAVIVAWYLLSRPKSASAPTSIAFPASTNSGGGSTDITSATSSTPTIPSAPVISSQNLQDLYHIMFPPGGATQTPGPPTFSNWLSQFLTLQPNLSPYTSALSQAYAFIVANQQYFTNAVNGSLVSQGQGFANQAAIINAALSGQTLTTSGLQTLGPGPIGVEPVPKVAPTDLQLSPLTVKGR